MDMQVKPETPGAQNASQQSGYITVVTEPDVGLREFISILRRRIWYPVGIVGPLLLIAAIVLSQLTPRYTASAMILIEENVGRAMSIDAVVGGLSGDSETVQSEAYVLASQTLANRVIDKLNLSLDPEFNTNIDAGHCNLYTLHAQHT